MSTPYVSRRRARAAASLEGESRNGVRLSRASEGAQRLARLLASPPDYARMAMWEWVNVFAAHVAGTDVMFPDDDLEAELMTRMMADAALEEGEGEGEEEEEDEPGGAAYDAAMAAAGDEASAKRLLDDARHSLLVQRSEWEDERFDGAFLTWLLMVRYNRQPGELRAVRAARTSGANDVMQTMQCALFSVISEHALQRLAEVRELPEREAEARAHQWFVNDSRPDRWSAAVREQSASDLCTAFALGRLSVARALERGASADGAISNTSLLVALEKEERFCNVAWLRAFHAFYVPPPGGAAGENPSAGKWVALSPEERKEMAPAVRAMRERLEDTIVAHQSVDLRVTIREELAESYCPVGVFAATELEHARTAEVNGPLRALEDGLWPLDAERPREDARDEFVVISSAVAALDISSREGVRALPPGPRATAAMCAWSHLYRQSVRSDMSRLATGPETSGDFGTSAVSMRTSTFEINYVCSLYRAGGNRFLQAVLSPARHEVWPLPRIYQLGPDEWAVRDGPPPIDICVLAAAMGQCVPAVRHPLAPPDSDMLPTANWYRVESVEEAIVLWLRLASAMYGGTTEDGQLLPAYHTT